MNNKNVLNITRKDLQIAICMHRDMQGHTTLEAYDGVSGKAKCQICGEVFKIIDNCDDRAIQDAVDNLIDILQTTKTLHANIPSDEAIKIYRSIAPIKKIPALYKFAIEEYMEYF